MALPNAINITITEEQYEDIQRKLEELFELYPFLVLPLPIQKKVRTIAAERVPFAQEIINLSKIFPAQVPGDVSLVEIERDLHVNKQARRCGALFNNPQVHLEQIAIAAGHDVLLAVERIYANLQNAAKNNAEIREAIKPAAAMLKRKPKPPLPPA